MSAASSSAEAPYGATHRDPRRYYWKNESNGSGGEGTWYIYSMSSRTWTPAQKPGDLIPISGADDEEDDDDEDEEDGAGATAAPASAAAAAAEGEEDEDDDEEADPDYEGVDIDETAEEQQKRYENTLDIDIAEPDSLAAGLGLDDEEARAVFAEIDNDEEQFSQAFAAALARAGVEAPDTALPPIGVYGLAVANGLDTRVESGVSAASPGGSDVAGRTGSVSASASARSPPQPPLSASREAPGTSASQSGLPAYPSQTFGFFSPTPGTQDMEAGHDRAAEDEKQAAAVAALAAQASAAPPGSPRPSAAQSVAASLAQASTQFRVIQERELAGFRAEPSGPNTYAAQIHGQINFSNKSRLDEVCILCSCTFRERLSGNKVSGKPNLKKLAGKIDERILESFLGLSYDHHWIINFLNGLIGGIRASDRGGGGLGKSAYTSAQYDILKFAGDIVCWNCNYVKNDALFQSLRISRDADGNITFEGLQESEERIKDFCEKLWKNTNKEGQLFLPADMADAKRLGAKNTLQLAILRKLGAKATPAEAKKAWMAHQVPVLVNRTRLLCNALRANIWPQRALNRLKALGVAKRASDLKTKSSQEYLALNAQLTTAKAAAEAAVKGSDDKKIKVAAAAKIRSKMNDMIVDNGNRVTASVVAQLDVSKPPWIPGQPIAVREPIVAGDKPFVEATLFRSGSKPPIIGLSPAADIRGAKAAAPPAAAAPAAAPARLATVFEEEEEEEGVFKKPSGRVAPASAERPGDTLNASGAQPRQRRRLGDLAAAPAAPSAPAAAAAASPKRKGRFGGGFNARVWNQLQQEQHQAGSARQTRRRRGHRGTRRRRRYAEARS
jgi:hypothetical protein